ncbi:hypothetical protein Q8F55_001004 [Vanrija albida]|uniref:Protein kinase domain-containing protein n=1 Tax=Vanrija albida TaxID=181172 RepID=A0ABR3QEV2_9TREE
MPSSKSSLDKRDVYYRKGKSDGYRARSAYKLLHLDEEFDLFRGVTTAVDLCAAPGSWSQVLGQRLKPGFNSGDNRVVSVDLQPMAPLSGLTLLQTDITLPSTVPLVLDALGGRKADLVICDGAPDVTGVHDLDAYIHSQLLLAALTLSLTLLAPGATLIFKIFLSPNDPTAALLQSQLRAFFPAPPPGSATADPANFAEIEDDDGDDLDLEDDAVPSALASTSAPGPGFDSFGRRGGVWIRKPRSSRKGSGEAFVVARNFDPTSLPLPAQFTAESLAALRQHIGGTLTLESLGSLGTDTSSTSTSAVAAWPTTKGFVGTGNLNSGNSLSGRKARQALSLDVSGGPHQRDSSLGSIDGAPSPVEAHHNLFPSPDPASGLVQPKPVAAVDRVRQRATSEFAQSTSSPLLDVNPSGMNSPATVSTPIPLPSPVPGFSRDQPFGQPFGRDHSFRSSHDHGLEPGVRQLRELSGDGFHDGSSLGYNDLSAYPHGLSPTSGSSLHGTSPLSATAFPPSSSWTARERDIAASLPQGDGAVSPTWSSSSKTDAFFSTSQRDSLPVPPRPLPNSASLGRANSLGRGAPPLARARVVTTPAGPGDSLLGTSPTFTQPSTLRSVTGPQPPQPSTPPPVFPITSTIQVTSPGSIGATLPVMSPPRGAQANLPVTPSPLSPKRSMGTFQPSGDSSRRGVSPRPTQRQARPDSYIAREVHHADPGGIAVKSGEVLTPVADDTFPVRSSEDPGSWRLSNLLGQGAFASVWSGTAEGDGETPQGTVAAVKLVDRGACTRNSRTAIAFYREVEVLRHLVHPGIVGYYCHFSTDTHHCLVLERLSGGELFSLVEDERNRSRMLRAGPDDPEGFGLVRRIFGELARAVSWLHEVEVVHRDIKLENILLTVNPFSLPATSTGSVPLDRLPVPLVKLSDFGLSRFIRADSPLLTTRCGSEAFAAPEVIMGNLYDGRRTDAWALGVVLYALVAGELPFDADAPLPPGRARAGSTASTASSSAPDNARENRRRVMHRIAKGEYAWRDGVGTPAVHRVVGRLLVRDPARRSRVAQLWEEEWMSTGPGSVPPPHEPMPSKAAPSGSVRASSGDYLQEVVPDIPRRASDAPHVVVQHGLLVDHERIDDVARQDVNANQAYDQ